jgi:P4 family phage/plasmid primase-like protien
MSIDFRDAMTAAGCDPGATSIVADGLIHRFRGPGDKRGHQNCWFALFEHGGAFGSWRLGFSEVWNNGAATLSKEQRRQVTEQIKAAQQQVEAERAQRNHAAAAKAKKLWAKASPISALDANAYLIRKNIQAHCARQFFYLPNLAIIPLYDVVSSELVNLQFISPTGSKRFLSGGRTSGCYCPIGGRSNPSDKFTRIAVAEGFATAATIHEATAIPVAVAFNAGNLPAVAEGLRNKYPEVEIILCADNDYLTAGNPGVTKARAAAARINGRLIIPANLKGTDWNDLAIEAGLDAVKQQIFDALDQPPSEPQPPDQYSDIALSNSFVAGTSLHSKDRKLTIDIPGYGSDLRYIAHFDHWLEYDPRTARWVQDRKLRVYTKAKHFLTLYAQGIVRIAQWNADHDKELSDEQKDAIVSAAEHLSGILTTAKKVHETVSLTRSHGLIAKLERQFDADIWLINCQGTAVDLRTGVMRPACRDDYFTKTTPVAPRDEPTPIFDQFMADIMGAQIPPKRCKCAACAESTGGSDDKRLILHLQEVDRLVQYNLREYGSSLSGDVEQHKAFIQEGEGGNGKGTLNNHASTDIFGRAPDGYSAEIPIEALLVTKNEQHPTELMQLWHTRLALARESDEASRWNEGRVKKLTGGDPIIARYMRQDFVTFEATHTLIVFVNVRPVLQGADQAAWKRRLQITPFPQLWADDADQAKGILTRDPEMGAKLHKEAPGVLFKLINACRDWYKDGRDLQPPKTVLNATNDYLVEQSGMRAFLADEYDDSDTYATTTVTDMFPRYVDWCDRNHEWRVSRRNFPAALERAGVKITRTGAQRGICLGLKLKP